MAKYNNALTAEYDYVSPSMYAYARRANEAPEYEEKREPKLSEVSQLNTKKAKHLKNQSLSLRQMMMVVLITAIIGLLAIGIVWTTARTSAVNYSINQLKGENAVLENEIKMLVIDIESSNSLQSVGEYAVANLGLVYPKASQCIYLEDTGKQDGSLAQTIKDKVYNSEKEA